MPGLLLMQSIIFYDIKTLAVAKSTYLENRLNGRANDFLKEFCSLLFTFLK